jgi:hypothetical protein
VADHPLLRSLWERLDSLPDDAERVRFLGGDEAAEQGFRDPTTALMSYLDGMAVAERISALAQYGVTVPTGAGEVDVDPASLAVADELLRENPEFADIPEERRRELMAQVLANVSTRNEGAR